MKSGSKTDLDWRIQSGMLYCRAVVSYNVRSCFSKLNTMTTDQTHQPTIATSYIHLHKTFIIYLHAAAWLLFTLAAVIMLHLNTLIFNNS